MKIKQKVRFSLLTLVVLSIASLPLSMFLHERCVAGKDDPLTTYICNARMRLNGR